jgi:two-component system sensor histidine kinase YesM
MSATEEQLRVYLENNLRSVMDGFVSIESSQNMVNLQTNFYNDEKLRYTAASYIELRKQMLQLLDANSVCAQNIYFNYNDGQATAQVYSRDTLKINYNYSEWHSRFPEQKYYWVNADACRDLIPDPEVGAVLFHMYHNDRENKNGIFLLSMKKSFFSNALDIGKNSEESCFSLITDDQNFHFGNQEAAGILDRNADLLKNEQMAYHTIYSRSVGGYYNICEKLQNAEWVLVYSVKEASISNAHYLFRDILLTTLIGILLISLVIMFTSNAISRSLNTLTKKVEAEDVLDHEISVHSYAEITTLSNGLENMRRRINHLLQQIKEEQETKRKMEIMLMQEQINPHFLYNTLYAIIQLCEMNEPKKAGKMLSLLASFYRIGLSGGKEMISVREELTHVKDYLQIQKYQYSDMFDYTIDCDEEIMDDCIPRMSLQPLVENAIHHGIKRKHGYGSICILGGTNDGENIYLEVHDDGPGMTEEETEEIRESLKNMIPDGKGKGIGLRNVNARIRLEFGGNSGIEIEQAPNDTCIRIRFRAVHPDSGSNDYSENGGV